MRRRLHHAGALLGLVVALGCRSGAPTDAEPHTLTFADVPVRALQSDPASHVGEVFVERFTFSRVWWSPDRARPGQRTTELPTHFEARIVTAPLYVARIEFTPADDAIFEPMRDETELCLRVRFLRLQPVSDSPVFALEGRSDRCTDARRAP